MAKPTSRKRSKRNRPLEFFESLSPVVPMAPALRPTDRDLQRFALYMIWAAAAIAAGIALGLFLKASQPPAATTEVPNPVATATVAVAPIPATPTIQASAPIVQPTLTTTTATAVTQAQAGNPLAVVSAPVFQPTAASDALQPGFQQTGQIQGTVGTAAVH